MSGCQVSVILSDWLPAVDSASDTLALFLGNDPEERKKEERKLRRVGWELNVSHKGIEPRIQRKVEDVIPKSTPGALPLRS